MIQNIAAPSTRTAWLRRAALVLALLLLANMLVACGGNDNKAADPSNASLAALDSTALASGGKTIDSANAKELSITQEGDTTTLALRFVLGSQQQSVDEAVTQDVPSYRAYTLSSPARFVLEFDSLAYWDYIQHISIEESDPFFYGIFNQIQLESSGADIVPSAFRIVFQLRQDVDVQVSDKDDTLTAVLQVAAQQNHVNSYHIMSTELQAFNTGQIQQSVGFFPTLSNDLTNQVILSKAFAQESEAQNALATLLKNNSPLLNEQNAFIVAIDGNALPSYADSADFRNVYEQYVIRRAQTPEKLPVVMPDGIYLCATSDNLLSLFSKQIYDGDDSTQELWTLSADGKFKRLTDIEFADIAVASFSPDGKKLGLIERTADSSYLYVYDLFSNELDSLSEAGLGNTVSAFVWDTLGTALYAIAGNDKQQLLKYDFTVADESLRITSVEENEIGEGDLGFYNGEIYFTNVTEDEVEQVFHIRPEGGLRTPFTEGGSFRLSQDGRYMAVLRSDLSSADSDEELGGQTVLMIRNMTNGEEHTVTQDKFVVTYAWSTDGLLYYTESISNDFSDEYSYRFMCYEPNTTEIREICDFVSSDFAPAPDPNVIYIPMIRNEEGETPIHATYRLRLDSLPATPASSTAQPAASVSPDPQQTTASAEPTPAASAPAQSADPTQAPPAEDQNATLPDEPDPDADATPEQDADPDPAQDEPDDEVVDIQDEDQSDDEVVAIDE